MRWEDEEPEPANTQTRELFTQNAEDLNGTEHLLEIEEEKREEDEDE